MKICYCKIHLAEDNKELNPLITLPEWLVLVCLTPGGSCPVSVSNIYRESQQIIAGTIQSFVEGQHDNLWHLLFLKFSQTFPRLFRRMYLIPRMMLIT